jgi:hypothetical protein
MSIGIDELLDNEWFVVRHSGETPEIALYAARHYLTEADDGPKLSLSGEQWAILQEAAGERYREIVLRDLQIENRDKSIYRGIKRSIINYQRFECFCHRHNLDARSFRKEVAAALLFFLAAESVDIAKGSRSSSINCSFEELNVFARKIGLIEDSLPRHMREICPE